MAAAMAPGVKRETEDARDKSRPRLRHVASKGEEEPRQADREKADERQLARQEREGCLRHADGERQCEDIDRLGDEAVGRPPDVRDDSPALGDHRRQRGKPVVEKNATARLAGVPEPSATPKSASLMARTSLIPSPIIARTWPRSRRP